jgi:hypothetical protein
MSREEIKSVYVGSLINAKALKAMLEQENISSLLRDRLTESNSGGYGSPVANAAELYVSVSDYTRAKGLADAFAKKKE